MSNFLGHDMTAINPHTAQKIDDEKRAKANRERTTKRAISLGHEQEEQKKDFKDIKSGELGLKYNLDGTEKKQKAANDVSEGERRAVKRDDRITNGANQYTPEQLEKMRATNELRKQELMEFKRKHLEAKQRQETLEKEKSQKENEIDGNKFGQVQDYKSQNGRTKGQAKVYDRTDNFDIILGKEVTKISDGFEGKTKKATKAPEKLEEGGQGDIISESEFKDLGIKSRQVSKQNSAEMFDSVEHSVQTSANTSRIGTATLPNIKNASTQVSKPPTASTVAQVSESKRPSVVDRHQVENYGRKSSDDYKDPAHDEKLIKQKKDQEFLRQQIKEKREKQIAEKQASQGKSNVIVSVNEIIPPIQDSKYRGIGNWRKLSDEEMGSRKGSLESLEKYGRNRVILPRLYQQETTTSVIQQELEQMRIRRQQIRLLDARAQRLPLIYPRETLKVGKHKFYTLGIVGKGLTSVVFKSEYSNKMVAIKKSKFHGNLETYTLEKELSCLEMLKSNPYVIQKILHEFKVDALYTVFEYAPITLHEMMNNLIYYPERIAYIMKQLCRAVQSLHQLNIVHKDIKPLNIGLFDNGRLKLLDFGFSELLISNNIYSEWEEGTLEYMPPECLKKSSRLYVYGLNRDCWAVGCIYYEMLLGLLPWYNDNDEILANNICSLKSISCPNEVLGLLLSVDRRKRISMLQALEYFK